MSKPRPKRLFNALKDLGRLWPFLKSHKKALILSCTLIPLISVLQMSVPFILKRTIDQGVKAEGGFIERTRDTWTKLDDAVTQKVPATFTVKPSNTLSTLEELTRPTPGAEKTSQVMSTPKVVEIRSAMRSDLAGTPPERVINLLGPDGKTTLSSIPIGGTPGKETVPYQAIRELRSKVGALLDNSLVSGIPGGELKKLYSALSRDLEVGATAAGAGKEFSRQQNFYRVRMDRIESVLDKVLGQNRTSEDVFLAMMPKNQDQASLLTATLRSLKPDERKIVTDAVIYRLGRAKPGQQNEVGDVFSSNTFLTGWSNLSGRAKMQFFPDEALRTRLDKLVSVASNIREGTKGFTNPSGTAGSFAAYGVYVSPLVAIGQAIAGSPIGGLGTVAAAGGSLVAANITAKMMTNPKIVDWLATAPRVKPEQTANHLAKLAVIYNQTDDPQLKQDLAKFSLSIGQQNGR